MVHFDLCVYVTDEAEKPGGMRTRLSTGSIHLNGTTTIAVAREIENNQRLQGSSPKDIIGKDLVDVIGIDVLVEKSKVEIKCIYTSVQSTY